MMKLHWSPKSPYVRKVMVCAIELGMDNQIERVRSVAAMLAPNPAIMQDNPLSKIPTLMPESGRPLFDSRVICEYLNDRASGALFPKQGQARWDALRWQSFGDGLLDALILWRNERERERPLEPLMGAFALKVDAALGLLEAEATALQESGLNIGAISIACALGYIDYRFETLGWRSRSAGLAAWHKTFSARPSMLLTEPADG